MAQYSTSTIEPIEFPREEWLLIIEGDEPYLDGPFETDFHYGDNDRQRHYTDETIFKNRTTLRVLTQNCAAIDSTKSVTDAMLLPYMAQYSTSTVEPIEFPREEWLLIIEGDEPYLDGPFETDFHYGDNDRQRHYTDEQAA
jgi:hypothetical protein